MNTKTWAAALAACIAMAGCGGGADTSQAQAQEAALRALSSVSEAGTAPTTQAPRPERRAQAFSSSRAEQLFALAEANFKQFFPSHQATASFAGWSYRYYPETGIYLAVIDVGVYVLGGEFGPLVQYVGEVGQFIGAAGPAEGRQLTATILNQCPDATGSNSPQYYQCMVGVLSGVQTFDSTRNCRLEVSSNGRVTLSTSATSSTVGPDLGDVKYDFVRVDSDAVFSVVAWALPTGGARLTLKSSPTLSMVDGGFLHAEFAPTVTSPASISCKLTVPR